MISFSGEMMISCQPGVSCNQAYRFRENALLIREAKNFAKAIDLAFVSAANRALEPYATTVPRGWIDRSTEVCRSYMKSKSLVLPAPYFDDVEYCVRLQKNDNGTVLWIEIVANISVTKNPGSGYRDPQEDEFNAYGTHLRQIHKETSNLFQTAIASMKLNPIFWPF